MATGIGYWKCSPELYKKYLSAGKIIDTDFYFIVDDSKNIKELYLGRILLSSEDESLKIIEEKINNLQIEDLNISWDTTLIFDGGNADVDLAILNETILL